MSAPLMEDYVDLSKGRMYYCRRGTGPVLVMAHGFSDNGQCWNRLADDLAGEYDILMPDSRGHGRSERVSPGEVVDRAADLAEFIQALNLINPIILGHSMGAATAAELAARFPTLPRAILLEDPPWRDAPPPSPDTEKKTSPVSWLDQLINKTEQELLALNRAEQPGWDELERLPWAQSKLQLDPNIRLVAPSPRTDWRDTVRRLKCATLLITGDPARGVIVSPEAAREAAEINPLVEVVQIANAGHSIRRDNYPDFLVAVRDFLNNQD